ncbi:MAG: hypothetical protein ACKVOW_14105 [Chitinophagaceae bacterium]
MYKRIFYTLLLMIVCYWGYTQDNIAILKLEYVNRVYYVADSNKLLDLEKTESVMKSKAKLAGFGGYSSAYIIEGSSSSVQIGNQQASFIIQLEMMLMDASQMIQLYRFEKKEKTRESVISKGGVMGTGSSQYQTGIKFNVKKTEKGMYWLIPEKSLPPGEYGFINLMSPSPNGSGRSTSQSYTTFAFTVR